MAFESRSRPLAVSVAVLTGLAASILIASGSGGDIASSETDDVQVVTATAPARTLPIPVAHPSAPFVEHRTGDPKELTTALMKRFPSIREASLVCEEACKLVAVLGDQAMGPTPFGGNLERFLVEQGYELEGGLVVDQPGDNDTLLTIPVSARSMTHLRDADPMNLPTNR